MEITLSTMSSSTHTSLGIFGKTRVPSTCSCDPPCTLLSTWPFHFSCGDEDPTSSTPSCTISHATSGSWLYGARPVAFSVCRGPCPLEVSDSILSRSSSIFTASYDGLFSSSIVTGFVSYSGVWISSKSTTTSVAYSLASIT
jgi:hypothetical protein